MFCLRRAACLVVAVGSAAMGAAIIWFRRDLRLADHPALNAALAHGVTTPLFV
ncbi:MAG: deoxyribodipyrimidine photo-lyase, partial [Actinomycetota bacterium]